MSAPPPFLISEWEEEEPQWTAGQGRPLRSDSLLLSPTTSLLRKVPDRASSGHLVAFPALPEGRRPAGRGMAQEVTYADLSLSWRTPPAQPKGSDDGELTYETISGPSPQAEQSRSGPGSEGGVKRLLLPIALGLTGISLLLLAAVVGLGAKNWQLSRQLQEASRAHEAQSLSLQEQLEASREKLEQQQQAREVRLNATWSTAWKDLCPKEWVLYQGRCLFFSREKRSWEESQNDCEWKAARLLIIEPPTVLDPLPGFLHSSDYWIGLHKIQYQQGRMWVWVWVWVDGSRPSWFPFWPFTQQPSKGRPRNTPGGSLRPPYRPERLHYGSRRRSAALRQGSHACSPMSQPPLCLPSPSALCSGQRGSGCQPEVRKATFFRKPWTNFPATRTGLVNLDWTFLKEGKEKPCFETERL